MLFFLVVCLAILFFRPFLDPSHAPNFAPSKETACLLRGCRQTYAMRHRHDGFHTDVPTWPCCADFFLRKSGLFGCNGSQSHSVDTLPSLLSLS
jgi:hypothetical protein